MREGAYPEGRDPERSRPACYDPGSCFADAIPHDRATVVNQQTLGYPLQGPFTPKKD